MAGKSKVANPLPHVAALKARFVCALDELGLTQTQIAAASGIPSATVYNLLKRIYEDGVDPFLPTSREVVQSMREKGLSCHRIAKDLGIAQSAVRRHAAAPRSVWPERECDVAARARRRQGTNVRRAGCVPR